MATLTVADLVKEIAQLGTTNAYDYVSGSTRIRVTNVRWPEGPISFIRWDSAETEAQAGRGNISTNQLAKIALACSHRPNYPLHVDRLFSAGGNSRSALEALLAYTPHFFMCYPQRVDSYTGEVLTNLKHIMWCPDDQHQLGEIATKEYGDIITELEVGLDFGDIRITSDMLDSEFKSIDIKREHVRMQLALIKIGNLLNFRTWVAKNDRSIVVGNQKLGELPGVIQTLEEVPIFYSKQIKDAALLVDCIWFTDDGNRIPAVIEIEHSTGVTSGLTRMTKLRDAMPAIHTTFAVVAPNSQRAKVVTEANKPLFGALDVKFMSYSTVRDLYDIIQRYPSIANVVDYNFVSSFMQSVV